ncbi:MAG: VTT domain-containing protein [Candidatus Omnitrophota bacterium]
MNIRKHQAEIGFFVLVATFFLLWFMGRFFNLDTSSLQAALARFPLFLRGLLFIVLYVAVTFFVFFSKDFFWLAGALLFGAATSTLLIFISELINAFILFFLARFLGRAYVDKRLSDRYRKLDEKLAGLPFFWLFLMRAVPLIPYRFLDLAAGLTRLRFRRYLAACILGTPLKTFWIQSILVSVGDNIYKNPYAVAEYFLDHQTLLFLSFLYVLGVILVVFKMAHRG